MAETSARPQTPAAPGSPDDVNPWPALFALCIGFFMILVDTTIVSVATPAIIEDLDAEVNSVVWVTSAYLLAYAVPVLITGRLGDRFGPKNLYLLGLTVFTLSSLWCGLTGTIEGLIVARVFQGLGAAMITPQTMAIITRIFPSERRGQAMALWGATAGVATLVGPILGGVLVDALGWEWIFFINIPVGIVGFALAWRLVPEAADQLAQVRLAGRRAVGHRHVPAGLRHPGGPPVRLGHDHRDHHRARADRRRAAWCSPSSSGGRPATATSRWCRCSLFRDRNFSLANVAISVMGFAITALAFPIMLYAQLVRGLSPTQSALLLVPMAIMSIVLAPWVGKLTDSVHPRVITGFGFAQRVRVAGLALARDDAGLGDLGDPAPDGAARRRQRLHLGADLRHRDPQPADAPGRCGCRHLQRDPAGRRRAGLRRDRGADGLPPLRAGTELPAERGRRRQPPGPGLRPVRRRDVPVDAAARRPSWCIGFLAAISFARPKHLERAAAEAAAAAAAGAASVVGAGAAVTRSY